MGTTSYHFSIWTVMGMSSLSCTLAFTPPSAPFMLAAPSLISPKLKHNGQNMLFGSRKAWPFCRSGLSSKLRPILIAHEDQGGDEFDPLLSPHSYPNGIDAGAISKSSSSTEDFGADAIFRSNLFSGKDLSNTDSSTTPNSRTRSTNNDFDPLLSPHSYPNGIDAGPVPSQISEKSVDKTHLNGQTMQSQAPQQEDPLCDVLQVFDPLLSPHSYPDGIPSLHEDCEQEHGSPSTIATSSTAASGPVQKIGILLIDHGSKRQASNDHLLNVARAYEATLPSTSNSVVRVAHMELADPSILDAIRGLVVNDHVTKVICHPYFLSPGRHATTDVPRMIQEAVDFLEKESYLDRGVEILVTKPLGVNLELMVSAVGTLVKETLEEGTPLKANTK